MSKAFAAIVIILAVSTLAGCDKTGEPMAVPQDVATPVGTLTEMPAGTPVISTPTLNYKELAFVHEDETEVAIRTEVALTAVPTWTPGGAPTGGPTNTPVLGLSSCANTNSLEPYMISCWAGVYNGDIVNVSSGRDGRAGDMTQGLVFIFNRNTHDWQYIPTPDKVGAVQIVAINGTLFTLTTVDHTPPITYTFDLATRQWVPSPLTPVPTLTLSP